jgi:geranylgeranyl diphosphate synthase type II
MQTLNQFQSLFEQFLREQALIQSPEELYMPVQYILDLGGKRLRPIVLMLGYAAFDDKLEKALPAAMAIELFHNFTLIHDDIMDAAPLRRGKPTVHHLYGTNSGILSGDVMLAMAYKYLLKSVHESRNFAVLQEFTKTAIEVCEGQQMDINFEKSDVVDIPMYLKMIELKTSVLVACSLKIGALIAGASSQAATHLYEFGKKIGIAFQIQDDLLDAFGSPEKFGKKVGGDIVQNKKTILYLKALELADKSTRHQLTALYENTGLDEAQKISSVICIFDELKVLTHTKTIMQEFQKQAFTELDRSEIHGEKKELLQQFALELMNREV